MAKKYSRPGVEGAARLVLQTEAMLKDSAIPKSAIARIWNDIESQYNEMILEKGGKKLASLDEFCTNLGNKFQNATNQKKETQNFHYNITKEELLKIVEWKFAKGKPRYALMKHLNSNSDTSVLNASKNAYTMLSKVELNRKNSQEETIKHAIQSFCELKGVGPATASAVLCLFQPDYFAFMDDEVIECLYDGKRGYTNKIYLEVNSKCMELSRKLGHEWTPYRVGRTLWTASRICASVGIDTLLEMISEMKKDTNKKSINDEKDGKRSCQYSDDKPSERKCRRSKRIKTK